MASSFAEMQDLSQSLTPERWRGGIRNVWVQGLCSPQTTSGRDNHLLFPEHL